MQQCNVKRGVEGTSPEERLRGQRLAPFQVEGTAPQAGAPRDTWWQPTTPEQSLEGKKALSFPPTPGTPVFSGLWCCLPFPLCTAGAGGRLTFGSSGQLRPPRRCPPGPLRRCACHGSGGWPAMATAGQARCCHQGSSRLPRASHTLWTQPRAPGTRLGVSTGLGPRDTHVLRTWTHRVPCSRFTARNPRPR